MKIAVTIALAILTVCAPLAAFADSTTFQNTGGVFAASAGGNLSLSGSSLLGVSGLGPYDCPTGSSLCSGSLTLTTGPGHITSGTLATSATFGGTPPGTPFGNITVKGNPSGPGGAFLFSGAFSAASWTQATSASGPYWTFSGTIINGTLTTSMGTYTNISGGTITLTEVGAPKIVNGFRTWKDSGGSTTFPSPVPEQSTLTLLGTGLIGLGLLAKRRLDSGKLRG